MTQHGFKVIDAPAVLPAQDAMFRWRRICPFDWTIEHHPNCPIDGTAMETIAALVSLTLPEKIRCACCPRCGLVGYIDRPSEADIDRYYAETWMGEDYHQALDTARVVIADEPGERDMAVLRSLPIARDVPVLEIGCGYGRTVHALQQSGFTNIDATEHCESRAQAVRSVFKVNVTTEIPQKRYGLIVSHHVLEHCVNPAGLITACAERQEKGDYQWHTLPRFDAEPSMGVLFFLPHLWSFHFHALADVFHQCVYIAAADDKPASSLSVLAQKGHDYLSHLKYVRHPGYPQRAIEKLLRGLGLTPQRSVLSWQRDSDGCAWKSLPYAQQEAANNFPRSMVVEPPSSFVTNAPIEVQFPGRVEMYVK